MVEEYVFTDSDYRPDGSFKCNSCHEMKWCIPSENGLCDDCYDKWIDCVHTSNFSHTAMYHDIYCVDHNSIEVVHKLFERGRPNRNDTQANVNEIKEKLELRIANLERKVLEQEELLNQLTRANIIIKLPGILKGKLSNRIIGSILEYLL